MGCFFGPMIRSHAIQNKFVVPANTLVKICAYNRHRISLAFASDDSSAGCVFSMYPDLSAANAVGFWQFTNVQPFRFQRPLDGELCTHEWYALNGSVCNVTVVEAIADEPELEGS